MNHFPPSPPDDARLVEQLARAKLARATPRNLTDASGQLLAACDNPVFAKLAYHRRPGNPPLDQLSTAFADRALQLLRNISVECVPETEEGVVVIYRITVIDLESNTPSTELFRVSKLSYASGSADDRVVYAITGDQFAMRVAAHKSRIKRALVLDLVPVEIRETCLARCKEVALGADKKDLPLAIKTITQAYAALGVEVSDLKQFLGKSVAGATERDIEELRGAAALIREGELTWGEALQSKRGTAAPRPAPPATAQTKAKPAAAAAKKPRATRAPAATAPAASPKPQAKQPDPPAPRANRRDEEEDDTDDDGDELIITPTSSDASSAAS